MIKQILLTTAVLVMASCTSAEPYRTSGITPPGAWSRLTGFMAGHPAVALDVHAEVEQQWWAHFNDPALDRLIGQALAGNKTLQIAQQRVREARGERKAAMSVLYPQVNGTANTTRENLGFLYNKPVGILAANAEASWELDLFGENQERAAAAQAIVQAVEADRRGAAVTLLADTARGYFDYRNYVRQIALTEQKLADQKRTLTVTRNQFAGGLLSGLDVQRATAQVASTQAELPALRIDRDAALNTLAVLTGQLPGAVDAQLRDLPPLKGLDNRVIVAAPARILASRPDVRAAERQFAASISLSKATERELFPTISLTSMYGIQDTTKILAHPWTLAAGLTQPILNFGAISSQIAITGAQQQEAFLTYQQTVLTALADMENALSAYGNEAERNASLRMGADAAAKAEHIAHQQFEGGDIDLLDVLVAQRDTLTAQSQLAASDSLLRQDLVHIYTAAGGGWDAPR